MNKKYHIFYEYKKITSSDIGEKDFNELKSFILRQEEDGVNESVPFDELKIEETSACMKLSADKHGREILTIKNYVGTIMLSSGTTIEILPKIYNEQNSDNIRNARALIVRMLQACGLMKYKSFQRADLALEKMTIFEIYIRIFLDEVYKLYQRGLKFGYVQKQENERFFKGKLLFSQHVKNNFAHAERFFIEYDEFNVNRPENKLIKTTLECLRKKTKIEENKRDLRRLSLVFDDVERSYTIDTDFQKCTGGRNMKEYEGILDMCKIFLKGCSFSSYSGKHNTTALLFPMEKLFESYVAKTLQKKLKGYVVSSQKRGKYLFDKFINVSRNMFSLRPDIYVEKNGEVVLLDTKWKIINDNIKENFGISQADMYQMHAYYTRFNDNKTVKTVVLLYPAVSIQEENFVWEYESKKEKIFAKTLKINIADKIKGIEDECMSFDSVVELIAEQLR
ncbi:MAG: McrC family protein [Clostridia bacterium]|nr:McrC family protein [Clostridia bacterium]